MTVLEMIFMGGIVVMILCGLGGSYFSVMWFVKNQALKKEMKKKFKNKKKKKALPSTDKTFEK